MSQFFASTFLHLLFLPLNILPPLHPLHQAFPYFSCRYPICHLLSYPFSVSPQGSTTAVFHGTLCLSPQHSVPLGLCIHRGLPFQIVRSVQERPCLLNCSCCDASLLSMFHRHVLAVLQADTCIPPTLKDPEVLSSKSHYSYYIFTGQKVSSLNHLALYRTLDYRIY